jgi:hypothetical protein
LGLISAGSSIGTIQKLAKGEGEQIISCERRAKNRGVLHVPGIIGEARRTGFDARIVAQRKGVCVTSPEL